MDVLEVTIQGVVFEYRACTAGQEQLLNHLRGCVDGSCGIVSTCFAQRSTPRWRRWSRSARCWRSGSVKQSRSTRTAFRVYTRATTLLANTSATRRAGGCTASKRFL
jgi:hypothetical protein